MLAYHFFKATTLLLMNNKNMSIYLYFYYFVRFDLYLYTIATQSLLSQRGVYLS
jgi:hypothetical protein